MRLCVLLALTQLLTSAATESVVYSGKTLQVGEGVCPDDQQISTVLDEIGMELRGIIRDIIRPSLMVGLQQSRPANSCSEISELHPSEHYWVSSHNGTAAQVYCDMDRVCGCNCTTHVVGGCVLLTLT